VIFSGSGATPETQNRPRLNVLSLFSGIGATDHGLERAGMNVVGQVELNRDCWPTLQHHWPGVPLHDDVRTAAEWWLSEPRPRVDVIDGGPPCQPFSSAGLGGGVDDDRNGWPWFLDVVRRLRPRYVMAENADELLAPRFHRVFREILGALADDGFAVEWDCLTACAMGAPHTRRRLFLVAYPDSSDGAPRVGAWAGGIKADTGSP